MSYRNIVEPPPHKHFNGWVYIIEYLSKNFSRKDFLLHPFLDRDVLFFRDKLSQLKNVPWVGIVHFPTDGAPLIHPNINSKEVIKYINSSDIKDKCSGLITLTSKAQKVLSKLTDIPIYRAWHPKCVDGYKFNFNKYFKQPSLQHPGKAYRNFYPFFNLDTDLPKSINIEPENLWLIDSTLELHGKKRSDYKVKISTKFHNNKKYIKQLSQSIGFGYYYDCEASNSILEHLMTNTPIVVNRLPSIEEYLGKDYPMYYENISHDPDTFLYNKKFIKEVESYLFSRSQMKEFSLDFFCKTINNLG